MFDGHVGLEFEFEVINRILGAKEGIWTAAQLLPVASPPMFKPGSCSIASSASWSVVISAASTISTAQRLNFFRFGAKWIWIDKACDIRAGPRTISDGPLIWNFDDALVADMKRHDTLTMAIYS